MPFIDIELLINEVQIRRNGWHAGDVFGYSLQNKMCKS